MTKELVKKEVYDQPSPLMLETIRLIKEVGLNQATLKTELPYIWLRGLAAGSFRNPSINRVLHAYEKLSGTKIIQE